MGKFPIRLGKLGGGLGILAGIIEMSIGKQILPWIGNKGNPVLLGVITFLLSGIAFLSVLSASKRARPTNDRKLAIFLGVFLPAVICFTTVGRLWYLPGLILIITSLLIAYEYWFVQPKVEPSKTVLKKFRINQMIGGIGSLIILGSFIMGFLSSSFGLFKSEILIKEDLFRFEILPMDFVRSTNLSRGTNAFENIEVSLVMIVYILLILGAAITLIAVLAKSRIFKGIGGSLVFTGLVLFLFWLPEILEQAGVPSMNFQNIIGSLGMGWYLSLVGMSLIIITSLFKLQLYNDES